MSAQGHLHTFRQYGPGRSAPRSEASRRPGRCLGESLERLAGRGDHDAAALLAEIDRPEQREFWRLFDEAVEVDPFWSKTADGRYRCKKGAVHDTPEKLVAAYKMARKG